MPAWNPGPVKNMKKLFSAALGALIGTALAAAAHCSFMTVEMTDSSMLPYIEPGQDVIVFLLTETGSIETGDVVAYREPFHTVDGGNRLRIRRVAETGKEKLVLSCDALATGEDTVTVSKQDVLGKALLY